MLSKEDNERLTRVGPGTPMGNFLRRYWLPIAISADVRDAPLERRLLGENLVVFRTTDGRVGVVDERCTHRRTSLLVGISEADGIRCGYHGWKFGLDGKVLEQPPEPRPIPRSDLKAYPAQDFAGLIWTYMGPAPAPLIPRFDLFVLPGAVRDIGHAMLDFNWLQAMENSVDPHHGEWLHGRFMNHVRARNGLKPVSHYEKKHVRVAFDEHEYGIVKRRLLENGSEDDDGWKIGHPLLFPYMLRIGGAAGRFGQFQIRVPVDDTHTWHLWYTAYCPPKGAPAQPVIPGYAVPLWHADGTPNCDFIDGQDIHAWRGQGTIADRTRELLGTSDAGIAMYRRMLKEEMARAEAGQDPKGVIRDPAKNVRIDLPVERLKPFSDHDTYLRGVLDAQAICYSPINQEVRKLFEIA